MPLPQVPLTLGNNLTSYSGYVIDAGINNNLGAVGDWMHKTRFSPATEPINSFTSLNAYYRDYTDNDLFIAKNGGFGVGKDGLRLPTSDGQLVHYNQLFPNLANSQKDATTLYNTLQQRAPGVLQQIGFTDPKQLRNSAGRKQFMDALNKNFLGDSFTMGINPPMKTSEIVNASLNGVALAAQVGLGFANYLNARQAMLVSQEQFNTSYELARRNYINQAKSYNADVYDKYAGRAFVGQSSATSRSIQRDAKSRYVDEKMDKVRINKNGKVERSNG